MKNILLICQKELKSYFASPIAYAVMAIFGLIFGWVFLQRHARFRALQLPSADDGPAEPMNVNEQIIRPLLGFAGTIALFLIPMITMRLFAEEKRTGTIELLLTSPVKDIEIILGKWLGALLLYLCVLVMSMLDIALLFAWGKPDLKPVLVAYLGLMLQGGCLLAIGAFISTMTQEPDHRRRRHVFRLPAAVAAELVHGFRQPVDGAGDQLPVDRHPFREFRQRACSIPRT